MAHDEQHEAAPQPDQTPAGSAHVPAAEVPVTDVPASDDVPAGVDGAPHGDLAPAGAGTDDVPVGEDAGDTASEAATWRRFDLRTDFEAGIEAAVEAIEAGRCIVLPTDTVYGIGADPFSGEAVQGLLDAKHRGRDMPPPVLIAEPAMLEALGSDVEAYARRLADECWPGALTLIVSMQPSLRVDLGDTRGTIALRVPDHDATRDLLRRTGPLAVSSANVSGRPSSTSIDDAIEQLGNSVAVYLDAGPTPGETPSTIIDFVSESFGRIVRQGALGLERIREINPFVEEFRAPEPEPEPLSEPVVEPVQGDQDAVAVFPDASTTSDTDADPLPTPATEVTDPGTHGTPREQHDGDADPAL